MDDQIFDLTLSAFTYGGDTLGRIPPAEAGKPDRAVFVPFGLPGERVRIRLVEQKRGFARGELLEVLEPAPERIMPRCKHFGVCGGCHYQHMPYEMQLKAKTEILRDQLRRIGHIENAPVQEAVACPEPYYYRNQVQFHLTAEGKLGYVRAGMIERAADESHRHRTAPSVLPITECHLPEGAINSLWPQLEFEPGIDIERVSIRQGKDEELMVGLESDAPDLPELEIEAGVSVAHIYEEHAAVLAGGDHVTMQVLGRDFQVSAASFFQVNTAMAEKMVEHVLANLPSERSTILDVYCGVGLFSAFLSGEVRAADRHRVVGGGLRRFHGEPGGVRQRGALRGCGGERAAGVGCEAGHYPGGPAAGGAANGGTGRNREDEAGYRYLRLV